MKKNQLSVGASVNVSDLSVAESVEKEEEMPANTTVTHVNVLIPVLKSVFDQFGADSDVSPILIHAGTATKRWKRFNKALVPANAIVNQIFFSQK